VRDIKKKLFVRRKGNSANLDAPLNSLNTGAPKWVLRKSTLIHGEHGPQNLRFRGHKPMEQTNCGIMHGMGTAPGVSVGVSELPCGRRCNMQRGDALVLLI
jgi:hypothetical protein